ncbi:apelin isoform X1 [Kryptolebias marmoratus]|uniref:apelin isoform X1 n=1 Tax=Kryptolebias marmoratus TaxID=37003 RepID=UPI0007F8F3A4|nr:apelin isoform X1 [Kryptolebias marmoratus]
MNVKILTLVIVLLVSLLCSASAVNEEGKHTTETEGLLLQRHGPMASTEHGRGLEETATVRKMAQQNPVRGGQTHRPAKRRRPRPRLSHKGPMPF